MRGLYVWGGVGRGKTHLVDLFIGAPRLDPKLRMHFHRFMQLVHGELNSLAEREDPLRIVAGRIAARARVLCFDEFYVSDITDAMILSRLLAALFERGVTLVATSNIEPSKLYAGGLQRERFLPAIELIERHTRVVRLGSDVDYRLRALERARTWYSPLGPRCGAGRCGMLPGAGAGADGGRWGADHPRPDGAGGPLRGRGGMVRVRDLVRGAALGRRLHRESPATSTPWC